MYIGYRKCPSSKTPGTDPYLGSYTDKTFKPTSKFILGVYKSRERAMEAEIRLHRDNDVANSPIFANKARSTSTGFTFDRRGKKFNGETREKMSLSRLGEKNPRYRAADWYHPDYGKILQKSVSEIIKSFPNQKLYQSLLSEVLNEKRSCHKNWRLLKNKDVEKRNKKNIPRDWYHPIYGKFLQKSLSDLIKLFPDKKLSRGGLSQVANEKKFHYRGWILLKNKAIKPKKHTKNILRDWYHPIYGEVFNKSCSELIRMFPDQKLNRANLHKVISGEFSQCKGWKKLKYI